MSNLFNSEIYSMFINNEGVTFVSNKVLKHSKPGRKLDQFTFRSFPQKLHNLLFNRIFGEKEA